MNEIMNKIADILSYPSKKHNFREVLNELTTLGNPEYSNLLYIVSKLHTIRIQQETGEYELEQRYKKRMNDLKEEYHRLKENGNLERN